MSRRDSSSEALLPPTTADIAVAAENGKSEKMLLISFALMIVVGVGNRVLSVLQMNYMEPYALYVNLLTTFAYIPVSLCYVIPRWMKQGRESMETDYVPQKVWAILGSLDSIAGVMQTIGTALLANSNGSIITLVLQTAVPMSMIITRVLLKVKYGAHHYIGSTIVLGGIVVSLIPSMSGGSSVDSNFIIGVALLAGSSIPMALSSVYKESNMTENDIDAVWLNLMVAVYQFIWSFPLLIPGAFAVNVPIKDIGVNLRQGFLCWIGRNPTSSDNCGLSPVFTNCYIAVNLIYNILIVLILKFGSANILMLSLTATVPITSLIFAIPGIPGFSPAVWELGLAIPMVMIGLMIYRFWDKVKPIIYRLLGWELVEEKK